MSKSTFNEKCPRCNRKIDVRSKWESRDYSTVFEFDCECGQVIECIVHAVPEFELTKAQTKEEYAEMLAKLVEATAQKEKVKQ